MLASFFATSCKILPERVEIGLVIGNSADETIFTRMGPQAFKVFLPLRVIQKLLMEDNLVPKIR